MLRAVFVAFRTGVIRFGGVPDLGEVVLGEVVLGGVVVLPAVIGDVVRGGVVVLGGVPLPVGVELLGGVVEALRAKPPLAPRIAPLPRDEVGLPLVRPPLVDEGLLGGSTLLGGVMDRILPVMGLR